MSVLVTPAGAGSGCVHSPDAPRARRGPGPPARGLGSTPGSPPWTASGVDSLPCSLDDTHSPSSSADGERCVGRVGIIARNCDTCAVFECSSAASFQPPMMARPCTITPSNRTRRRTRSRTEEDGLQNPLEENVIEENRTFTPADLLLFQNGDGTLRRFVFKVRLDYLAPAQVKEAFRAWFTLPAPRRPHKPCRPHARGLRGRAPEGVVPGKARRAGSTRGHASRRVRSEAGPPPPNRVPAVGARGGGRGSAPWGFLSMPKQLARGRWSAPEVGTIG